MDQNELRYAIEYARAMAQGIDPNTGELFGRDHICNQIETVRVLYTLIHALEQEVTDTPQPPKQVHPNRPNAGTPWTEEEDQRLRQEFLDHKTTKEMCIAHGRTRGAIMARLKKQGLIESRQVELP